MNNIVSTLEDKGDYDDRAAATATKMKNDTQKLKLARVKVYGAPILAFFDSGSISDVMSAALCQKLHLVSGSTKRGITMMDNKEAFVIGEIAYLPVTLGLINIELLCLMVQSDPYELISGRQFMKVMRVSLYLTMTSSRFYKQAKLQNFC